MVAKALFELLLEALHRADEDDPAHDVEVVGQVEVGLLLAEDQVGLADDADDLALGVDDRDRAEIGLGEQVDRLLRVLLAGDGGDVGAHDLGGGLHRGRGYSTAEPGSIPTGIESITSVAITDSAAPIRPAASRPARAWARTAGAGRGEGLEAAGQQRRDDPGEHVAGAGGRQAGAERTLTASRSPSVTIVSSPLRTTTAPAARAASRAQATRWASISLGLALEQAAELAGMRGETVGAGRGAIHSSRAGEGVEAVGVEDERRLDLGDDLARQLDRAGVAAEAGAEDAGGGALERPQDRLRGARRQAAVATRAADRHHLGLG